MEEITKLIDDLQPQDARYDTPIADDLLICTFPNGIRTWIFSYDCKGFQRRRSIGVYPEMSLADARQALFSVRKLQQVEDHLVEHGLGSEVMRDGVTTETASVLQVQAPRRWLERRTVSAALAGALMSIAIFLGIRQLPFDILSKSAPAPGRVALVTIAAPEPVLPRAADAPNATVVAVVERAPAEPQQALAPATSGVPAPIPLSPANQALVDAQRALEGTVSREALAIGIDGNRPVGTFDRQLTVEADAPTTVYYFTELRGMAGKAVLHRWMHEGKVVAEVPFEVGSGWVSTLHSSTTVVPSMTGRWEVLVCDASGKPLEQESFELARTAQLSSTVTQ